MTRTLILSHDTACNLLEAHAALAAWYYQLSDALRAAGGEAAAPSEEQRKAFLEQLAQHFPELAEAARGIEHPREYIPPPVFAAPPAEMPPPVEAAGVAPPEAEEPAPPPQVPPPVDPDAVVPPQAPDDAAEPPPPPSSTAEGAVAPPPMVDPKKVRYD